jgi:hypothetical protein
MLAMRPATWLTCPIGMVIVASLALADYCDFEVCLTLFVAPVVVDPCAGRALKSVDRDVALAANFT